MLVKLTARNQLTLPKAAISAVGPAELFDVQVRDGQIILTPVNVQRAGAVRAKLAEPGITDRDVEQARAWARRPAPRSQPAPRGARKPSTRRARG